MIQRPQSIFLLIIAISLLLTTLMPIWSKEEKEKPYLELERAYYLNAWSLQEFSHGNPVRTNRFPYALIGWMSLLVAGIATYELFRYNGRTMQIKLGALNALVVIMLLGCVLSLTIQQESHLLPEVPGEYQLGFLWPLIALASNLLANRCIREDEKQVKYAERMC